MLQSSFSFSVFGVTENDPHIYIPCIASYVLLFLAGYLIASNPKIDGVRKMSHTRNTTINALIITSAIIGSLTVILLVVTKM